MPNNLSLRKRIHTIIQLGSDSLESQSCLIREAAKLIGTLVSCSPGVDVGPLFHKQLELEKIAALKKKPSSFEPHMHFTFMSDIRWWTTKSC